MRSHQPLVERYFLIRANSWQNLFGSRLSRLRGKLEVIKMDNHIALIKRLNKDSNISQN